MMGKERKSIIEGIVDQIVLMTLGDSDEQAEEPKLDVEITGGTRSWSIIPVPLARPVEFFERERILHNVNEGMTTKARFKTALIVAGMAAHRGQHWRNQWHEGDSLFPAGKISQVKKACW